MGMKQHSPDDRRPNESRPGQLPVDPAVDKDIDPDARPWATIEYGLLKHRGPGDLLDIDPDVCGSLEVRPEDAGGLAP